MISPDIFDADERIVINSAAHGLATNEFTRKSFLDNLNFSINISEDQDILGLLNGLKSKVSNMGDLDWNELALLIPLFTPYGADSIDSADPGLPVDVL